LGRSTAVDRWDEQIAPENVTLAPQSLPTIASGDPSAWDQALCLNGEDRVPRVQVVAALARPPIGLIEAGLDTPSAAM